jgi:hypothetical protein
VSGRQDARFKIEVPVSAAVESWRCVLVQPRTRWNGVDDADDMLNALEKLNPGGRRRRGAPRRK